MSPKDIDKIASSMIAEKIDSGETVQMNWAIQEILNRFPSIGGDDLEFYVLCAREQVGRVVKRVIDLYDQPSESGEQMLLDGYEFLRAAYTVERDGSRSVVPIYLLTDEELEDRAKQFEEQAASMRKHAKEIRSYVKKRQLELQDTASVAVV